MIAKFAIVSYVEQTQQVHNSHRAYILEVCGSTRTRGYTRTRPVPAGNGSGTGKKSTGRVYPFLPVKNTIFHDV